MSNKRLFEESSFDALEARRRLIAEVDNWSHSRLLQYAKDCVELELQGMSDSFLFGYCQDELPDIPPPELEDADEDVHGLSVFDRERRQAS
jgi:hypothetical protein